MSEEHFDRTGVKEALEQFAIDGSVKEIRPYGNGHINDTFLAVFQTGDGEKKSSAAYGECCGCHGLSAESDSGPGR